MDYKKTIEKACSNLYRAYHSSEETDILGVVKERAKNMESMKKKGSAVRLTEIEVPAAEKKRRSALPLAAAGVIAAAGIGAFVLGNFAGQRDTGIVPYSDISTEAPQLSQAQEELSAAENRAAEENALAVYVFDGFTVRITDYRFDGLALELHYDLISDNGEDDPAALELLDTVIENGLGTRLKTAGTGSYGNGRGSL